MFTNSWQTIPAIIVCKANSWGGPVASVLPGLVDGLQRAMTRCEFGMLPRLPDVNGSAFLPQNFGMQGFDVVYKTAVAALSSGLSVKEAKRPCQFAPWETGFSCKSSRVACTRRSE
jgi:hypothetical protein